MQAVQTFSHFPQIPPPVKVRLVVLTERPCAYLPDRLTTLRAFAVGEIAPGIYQDFMDAGFRRSGIMIYQPVCNGCRQCRPIRVAVDVFRPNKSQRRNRKRNVDVITTVSGRPTPSKEKFELYAAYQSRWHQDEREPEWEDFVEFLYRSPTRTIEFEHRIGDRLVAVGICDVTPSGLSSVYFYFDPAEAKRGLGIFGALVEIDYAREAALPYYYLGYWVRDCAAMRYKADYGPPEVLDTDGVWRPIEKGMKAEG